MALFCVLRSGRWGLVIAGNSRWVFSQNEMNTKIFSYDFNKKHEINQFYNAIRLDSLVFVRVR